MISAKTLHIACGMVPHHPTGLCTHATSAIILDGRGGFKRSCLACEVEQPLTIAEARRIFGTG